MNITVKPISSDAKTILNTLKTEPRYVCHHYDEDNKVIVVRLKRWFGMGGTIAGFTQHRRNHITCDYLIPYAFKVTQAVQS